MLIECEHVQSLRSSMSTFCPCAVQSTERRTGERLFRQRSFLEGLAPPDRHDAAQLSRRQ